MCTMQYDTDVHAVLPQLVAVGYIATLGLILAGTVMDTFELHFAGLTGWLLGSGGDVVYSLFTLGQTLPGNAKDPTSASFPSICCCGALPLHLPLCAGVSHLAGCPMLNTLYRSDASSLAWRGHVCRSDTCIPLCLCMVGAFTGGCRVPH